MLWVRVYREHVWDNLWEVVLFYHVGPRLELRSPQQTQQQALLTH